MTRRLSFHWHLRRMMAAHDLWKTTDLAPLLRERGVNLSAAQVYRLVTDKPERLSMRTLVALCDIFDCSPADLVEPYVEDAKRKRASTAASALAPVTDLPRGLRPTRARIVDDER
jgi:DNA-binding Xre family transcriptional regulator